MPAAEGGSRLSPGRHAGRQAGRHKAWQAPQPRPEAVWNSGLSDRYCHTALCSDLGLLRAQLLEEVEAPFKAKCDAIAKVCVRHTGRCGSTWRLGQLQDGGHTAQPQSLWQLSVVTVG